jgi:hypothetical protein
MFNFTFQSLALCEGGVLSLCQEARLVTSHNALEITSVYLFQILEREEELL